MNLIATGGTEFLFPKKETTMFCLMMMLYMLMIFFDKVDGFSLSIILVTIGDNPLYGHYAAAPFFDVAYEDVSKKYPWIFQNSTKQVFHKPGLSACADGAAYMHAATGEIYDIIDKNKSFTVMICPGNDTKYVSLKPIHD